MEDTLYDGLTRTRRARLHRAAAEAMEQLEPANPPLAAIAHHYCRALPSGDRGAPSTTHAGPGEAAADQGASEQAVQHYEQARAVAGFGTDSILDVPQQTILLCDLGEAYEATGQHERAQEVYATAIELAEAADDAAGLARAALGLMGGVDESVGFNLTGTDATLVGILDRARTRLPDDEMRLRALVTARLAGARYDAGEVERAQELSADALDARAEGRRRARRSRWRWRSATPRCRVPRRSRTGCSSTTSCARSVGRSRCKPRCGGSATCSSAAGCRRRTRRWRR